MMIGVVATNKEKVPSVWLERVYRLTSTVYKKDLKTKIPPWIKKITKKYDYAFQKDRAPAHTAKTVQNCLGANISYGSNIFGPHNHQFEPPQLYLVYYVYTVRKRLGRHHTVTQMNTRLLWTAHCCRLRKASSGRSARASDHNYI